DTAPGADHRDEDLIRHPVTLNQEGQYSTKVSAASVARSDVASSHAPWAINHKPKIRKPPPVEAAF
ncbi:MAG: hypothetical protein AAF921_24745, partial [Cyanobacteria bacterium P01_D01_bin.44]